MIDGGPSRWPQETTLRALEPEVVDQDVAALRQALQEAPRHAAHAQGNAYSLRQGPSPDRRYVRFSFGPPMDSMIMGLEPLAEMVAAV